MKRFVIRKADGKLSVQEIEVAATDNVAVPPDGSCVTEEVMAAMLGVLGGTVEQVRVAVEARLDDVARQLKVSFESRLREKSSQTEVS